MIPPTAAFTLYLTGGNGDGEVSERVTSVAAAEFGDDFELEVVDLSRDVERAESDRILAAPTLILASGTRTRRLVGDMRDGDLLRFMMYSFASEVLAERG